MARKGMESKGKEWNGITRKENARFHDMARKCKAWHDMVLHGMTWKGKEWHGM
jgi:hypothetical protein